jgi:hypothetical protein
MNLLLEMTTSQLRRLVARFPARLPWFESRSGHVGFVMDRVALECGYSPSTSDSPVNFHSTHYSTFINHSSNNAIYFRY